MAQKLTLNADLREAILQQDLILASSQSAFTGYMVRHYLDEVVVVVSFMLMSLWCEP